MPILGFSQTQGTERRQDRRDDRGERMEERDDKWGSAPTTPSESEGRSDVKTGAISARPITMIGESESIERQERSQFMKGSVLCLPS